MKTKKPWYGALPTQNLVRLLPHGHHDPEYL